MNTSWQQLEVAFDRTHHLHQGSAAYPQRFLSVLKFHPPGLAAVKDPTGAFHIYPEGDEAYPDRFLQTFGFYEGVAAVESTSGWYHIRTDGKELYPCRFLWCGNYQEGYSSVQDKTGLFFHLNREGKKAYPDCYKYAGDFKDGYAVVQNEDGLCSHIDKVGHFLHQKWFSDLDVYHKGCARAKDAQGWFHIDRKGNALYHARYQQVEPFYNGVARVETHLGALHRINEQGQILTTLRKDQKDGFHDVSGDLVSYWRYYTLQAACQLSLFDHLPNTLSHLTKQWGLHDKSLLKLLCALEEMGYLYSSLDKEKWSCTNKGLFLQANHPFSLLAASRLWNEEHLTCWQQMMHTMKTGLPTFPQLYEKEWFAWLDDHPDKNQLYHRALLSYARKDYQLITSLIDFRRHHCLLDVGGSTGSLITQVLTYYPHLQAVLLDLPSVVEQNLIPSNLKERCQCVGVSFFEPWPSLEVDSAILSRVLHDWSDENALQILKQVHMALSPTPGSRLYIIEKIQTHSGANGSLLDLHMSIMTGGIERTRDQFDGLLKKAQFILEEIKPLNEVSSVVIAKKNLHRRHL